MQFSFLSFTQIVLVFYIILPRIVVFLSSGYFILEMYVYTFI